MQTFKNPYEDVSNETPISRINSNIPTAEYRKIQYIRPIKGTVQTTVNILFKKLIDALSAEGINSYADDERFVDFVTNCRIVRGTAGGANAEANARDDRGRTEGVCSQPQNPADVCVNTPVKARSRQKAKGGKSLQPRHD